MDIEDSGTETDQKLKPDILRSIFKRGLGRTLLVWFLLLSLAPLVFFAGISYRQARAGLIESALESLKASTVLKTAFIENWFHYRFLDLEVQATSQRNCSFLEALYKAYKADGRAVDQFVGSYSWAILVDRYSSDLISFRRIFGYYDLFLIDSEGNILFSVAGESDLGTNLFNGLYSGTLFAQACKDSLNTGRHGFSDFEFYAPSGNLAVGFLVSPIVDDNGEKIGLFAMQSSITKIDDIMQDRSGLGKTGESYLVGADLKMRSNFVLTEEDTLLRTIIETEPAKQWRNEHVDKKTETTEEQAGSGSIYDNSRGSSVLGIYTNLQIAGVSWGLIAEIEADEALSVAAQLGRIVIILGAATALIVLLLSLAITRRIVHPLLFLSETTRSIAKGRYSQKISLELGNEVGDLAVNFQKMADALLESKETTEIEDWLKSGQTGLANLVRGEQDLPTLGTAVIAFLARYMNCQIGVFYILYDNAIFKPVGSYAYTAQGIPADFCVGEGLIGQAALEKRSIILSGIPG